MQRSFAQAERARKARNNELLRRHHQTQVDNTYTPYLTKFLQLNQAIERYSGPFDYHPNLISRIFYAHILTLNYLNTRPTNNTPTVTSTERTEVGIQTDETPVVSTLSLTTYINIRKRLDELQRQNRLENQQDQGTSTETDTVDVGVNTNNSFGFDISSWIESPIQTPDWIQKLYEPIDDPAAELARQEALYCLFREDLTEYSSTIESPQITDTIDTSPRRPNKRKRVANNETPRRSLRLRTSLKSRGN